jgi:hypothetical protein
MFALIFAVYSAFVLAAWFVWPRISSHAIDDLVSRGKVPFTVVPFMNFVATVLWPMTLFMLCVAVVRASRLTGVRLRYAVVHLLRSGLDEIDVDK